MKERPILFSGAMIRAILEGCKTQTRRAVKDSGLYAIEDHHGTETAKRERAALATRCPFGQPGDRLWVREAWAFHVQAIGVALEEEGPFVYRADPMAEQTRLCNRWRRSIHMPRWASRILLEIVSVRVERLNDISEVDAMREGCEHNGECDHVRQSCEDIGCWGTNSYRGGFCELWESINGPGSWDANPWVWVIEFRRVNQ